MVDMMCTNAAWDPISALSRADRDAFSNRWHERTSLNLPGPFYTSDTDNCWTGRLEAPANVVYAGEYFTEHIYRQPRDPQEVSAVVHAASVETFWGYGCDGDDHWTPEAVRAWWRDRASIAQAISESMTKLRNEQNSSAQEAAQGTQAYLAYLADGAEYDLRRYLFRLEQGHYPAVGQLLPEI